MRIELTTSSLPRKCSTTELQRPGRTGRRNISAGGPPLKLRSQERKTRFEPATYSLEGCRSTNWATSAEHFQSISGKFNFVKNCGQGWIRTTELVRGQIYSLLPLATWLLAHLEPLVGIEPTTYWLQISCSTIWAKVAFLYKNFIPRFRNGIAKVSENFS